MEIESLVKKVVRICYEVHSELGSGFVEKVYENALFIALRQAGLEVKSQCPIGVEFRGELVGEFYADLIVEDSLILELKAVSEIDKVHKAQLLNYLKASKRETGLLVNFGSLELGLNRLYNRQS